MTDYDSPWKQMLARYFPAFLEFFFPAAYAGIDWTQGYTLLDKELQKVVRDATLGQRRADQLVRVSGRDGMEDRVLVHVEIQGEDKADFAQRMFVYNYRAYDLYGRPVLSDARAVPGGQSGGVSDAVGGTGRLAQSVCDGDAGAPEGAGDGGVRG